MEKDAKDTKDLQNFQEELKKAKAELWLLHEIGTAMRTTLNMPEVLYIILCAVTSQEGLGFNRAMLFLANGERNTLAGEMAIGSTSAEEAYRAWKQISDEKLSFDRLVEMYHKVESHVTRAPLNNMVKEIKIPLNENGGILSLCFLEGMNFEVSTKESRANIKEHIFDMLRLEFFVCVPLKGKRQVQGVLVVDNNITKKPITKDDVRILSMFADQAGLAIENAHLYEEVKFQAHTDSLTRLWNHGYFQNTLSDLIRKGQEQNSTITLAMLDLDNFKIYNDLLGHQKGDVALREVASVFKRSMRSEDTVCRYGGEEFAIIMPNINRQAAFGIIERLRMAIEHTFVRLHKETPLPALTISCGIASFPHDAQNKEELIKLADEALYESKRLGKNRTSLFTQDIS